ncbi:hypothetical protein OpiT1DRAFT_01242 [Opitutaceae bacterium TAV1]|nr:hypothetical protein OpiT1DRAFT_01242 [Opitutaceae bacterium TAV1]
MIPPPQQIQRIPTPLLWWRRGKGYVFRNVRAGQSLGLSAWRFVLATVIAKQDHAAQRISIGPDTRVTADGRIRVTSDGRRRIIGMVRYALAPRRDIREAPALALGLSAYAYSGSPETAVPEPTTTTFALTAHIYATQTTMTRTDAATVTFGVDGTHIIPAGRVESANKPTTAFTLSNWNYANP